MNNKTIGIVVIALGILAVTTASLWWVWVFPNGSPPPSPPPNGQNGVNLVLNPSAEIDEDGDDLPDYWTPTGYSDVNGDHVWCTIGIEGSRSLVMHVRPTPDVPQWHSRFWRQYWCLDSATCPFERGTTYKMRCSYKTVKGEALLFFVCWDQNSATIASASASVTLRSEDNAQSEWIYFTIPHETKCFHYGVAMKLEGVDAGATEAGVRADAFEIYVVSE